MPALRTVPQTSRMFTSWKVPFDTSLRTVWLPASMPSASQSTPAFLNSSSAEGRTVSTREYVHMLRPRSRSAMSVSSGS